MQRIVVGVDDSGRTRVAEQSERTETRETIYETTSSPPVVGTPGQGELRDLGVAPGIARWFVGTYPAGYESAPHYTNTVDLDTVLEGSMDLCLDDGNHRLDVGDCVVMPGVAHGWRAGPEGCTMVFFVVGAQRR